MFGVPECCSINFFVEIRNELAGMHVELKCMLRSRKRFEMHAD